MNISIFEDIEELLADKASKTTKTKQDKKIDKSAKSINRNLVAASLGTAAVLGHPKVAGKLALKTAAKGAEYTGKAARHVGKKVGEGGLYVLRKMTKNTILSPHKAFNK